MPVTQTREGVQMSQVTSQGQVAVVADVFVRDTPLAVTVWRGLCVRSRPFAALFLEPPFFASPCVRQFVADVSSTNRVTMQPNGWTEKGKWKLGPPCSGPTKKDPDGPRNKEENTWKRCGCLLLKMTSSGVSLS